MKYLCNHVVNYLLARDRKPIAKAGEVSVTGKISYLSESWKTGVLSGTCEAVKIGGPGFSILGGK